MTFEEIFSTSTTYQIILGLIPVIITELIKSDFDNDEIWINLRNKINDIINTL